MTETPSTPRFAVGQRVQLKASGQVGVVIDAEQVGGAWQYELFMNAAESHLYAEPLLTEVTDEHLREGDASAPVQPRASRSTAGRPVTYYVEQRVRHRVRNEAGIVIAVIPNTRPQRYRVAFDSRVWEVPQADLVPIFDDPFALLENPPEEVSPYESWLRREALRLLDAYRNDPTAALSNSRIEPQHHQISVALRALQKAQPRLIIADEVGLGKTIEAGLILKELRARGVLQRVLILAPASLVTQWQTELRSKFNEVFISYDSSVLRDLRERHPDENPWDVKETENVIASTQYARLEAQRTEIAEAHWDLVIVDEAHHARRRFDSGANLAYQLLEALRDRVGGLLLLTATPMQLETYELYSMVELVEPGLFEDYTSFERARQEIALINAQISWLRSRPGSQDERAVLARLLHQWKAPVEVLNADLSDAEGRRLVITWLESRHLLSEALVRNRKAHVGGFMKRIPSRIHVEPTPEELELEVDVQDYLRREYARSPAFGLVLVTFQKLIASSSRALALALERRARRLLDEQEDGEPLTDDPELVEELDRLLDRGPSADTIAEATELLQLARRARAIRDAKLDALDETLEALFAEQPNQKVLIFTQYLGTLEMIQERLGEKLRVGVFHGGMGRREKDAATHHFRTAGQVLISTEAGGEGRNFQFCHILFNYDLPWNPMRIEQRIGRLDRVGQKRNVLIYNFGVEGTLDERILDVLEHRIRIFTESVGALEPILGDIEERIKEIVLKDATNALREFDRYELDLEERLRRAREKDEQLRDFVMDERSFRRDEVEALLERERMASPEDLREFFLAALARYPTASVRDDDGVLTIDVPGVVTRLAPHVREWYRGSFDYRVALADETLDFFAFGHPLVDALVEVAVDRGGISPVGVLLAKNADGGVLVDYEVRLSGVRDRHELLSHVVDGAEVASVPEVVRPSDPNDIHRLCPLDEDERAALLEATSAAATAELAQRFEDFRVENDRAYDAERARLEKLFAFQRRAFEDQIARNESLIERLLQSGSETERRVIPALRGRIERDRQRLLRVEEERDHALAELERRREPSEEIRPVNLAFLRVDA